MNATYGNRSILERILPPNVDPEATNTGIKGVFICGTLVSVIWFLSRYIEAYQALFAYDQVQKKEVLIAGATIAHFWDFGVCAAGLMGFFLFIIAVWAILLYGSFSQGSQSLYLMRRLPKGKKVLLRYVLQPTLLCLVCAAAACAVLLGMYYIVWRFATPEACLPL